MARQTNHAHVEGKVLAAELSAELNGDQVSVRLEPFAAHCWVQYQHYALNEEVEEAANYTPIMAI